MGAEYQEKLKSLLQPVARALPPGIALEIKPFFGGAAAYADGRICISLTPVGLAMKLPAHDRNQLMDDGAKPLRYFPNAPIKKQYVLAPAVFLEGGERLETWARRSIDHALTLPPPKPRRRRKAVR